MRCTFLYLSDVGGTVIGFTETGTVIGDGLIMIEVSFFFRFWFVWGTNAFNGYL